MCSDGEGKRLPDRGQVGLTLIDPGFRRRKAAVFEAIRGLRVSGTSGTRHVWLTRKTSGRNERLVMSDHADKSSEQSPIARLAERQAVQFISDALRAGQRAILVTGRGQVSMRVPEAALAACAGTSARTLHIGPPLPEPPELQEMIGAAVEIAGGREMTPQAMARLLLFADPRPTVILAIDDAHTLSHRSLSYLTLMTELLAPDAPILQIVLAAEPALLDTLAQPEFERLRNRLCRPGFETFQTLHGGANGAFSGLRKPAHGRAAAGQAHVRYAYSTAAASPRGHGIARPAVYAAGGVVAIGCLTAIGYIAFSAFTVGPTLPPIPSLNSAAEQLGAAGNGDRAALSPNAAAIGQWLERNVTSPTATTLRPDVLRAKARRQPFRVLPRTKTLTQRRRRYWPRRRRPRLMAPPHLRQSNSVQQAMEIERPCLQVPLRQPLRLLPGGGVEFLPRGDRAEPL